MRKQAEMKAAEAAVMTAQQQLNSSTTSLQAKQQKVVELKNAAAAVDDLKSKITGLETMLTSALSSEKDANTSLAAVTAAAAAAKKAMVQAAGGSAAAAAAAAAYEVAQARVTAAEVLLQQKSEAVQSIKDDLTFSIQSVNAKEHTVYGAAVKGTVSAAESEAAAAVDAAQKKFYSLKSLATAAAANLFKILAKNPKLADATAAVNDAVARVTEARAAYKAAAESVTKKQQALQQAKATLADKQAQMTAVNGQISSLKMQITNAQQLLANATAAAAPVEPAGVLLIANSTAAVDAAQMQATMVAAAKRAAAVAHAQLVKQQEVAKEAAKLWSHAQKAADAAAQDLFDAQTVAGKLNDAYGTASAKLELAKQQAAAAEEAMKAAKERSVAAAIAVASLTAVARGLGVQLT